MKISLDWLGDYVKLDIPIARLVEKLNMIGLLVEDWEKRGKDVVFDIETYPNRPDTLGHLGVARELAAALGLRLKKQKWDLAEIEGMTSDLVDVQISDPNLCSRYCGIIVKGIKVAPSPAWLRKRIEAVDLKPINNVVDVTNYVLFSTAQPIHAFDLEKISGSKIKVRRAHKGEKLRSLEAKDVIFSSRMLVIADEKKPVALAGVIGGEESSVQEGTHDVFIESAYFDPISIRKTGKETGISTDASYRFERGADVSFAPEAALMAASLLTRLGGKATKGIVDVYPKPRKNKKVILRHKRIFALLGLEIKEAFILKTLSSLGFKLEVQQEGIWKIEVPHFRVDIEREADLVEEIARFYGYDKIPAHIPPLRVFEHPVDQKREKINKLRRLLFHYGFDEVMNFSFSEPEEESRFQTGYEAIEIRNPFSSNASMLKTTLIGGLLENIAWNKNRGAEGIHLFEVGNIYFWENETTREQLTLALVTTGLLGMSNWKGKNEETDFFHLKGTLESLMSHLRHLPFSFKEEDHSFFEPEYSLSLILKEEPVGFFGLLKKSLLHSSLQEDAVWGAELNLAALFEKQPQSFHYTPVVRFPNIIRDISFIADRSVSYHVIKDTVGKLSIPFLQEFGLYDRFSGASIPKDKVSLSFRLVYSHSQRTLLAEEIDTLQQRIINTLEEKFNFQLREGGKIDK